MCRMRCCLANCPPGGPDLAMPALDLQLRIGRGQLEAGRQFVMALEIWAMRGEPVYKGCSMLIFEVLDALYVGFAASKPAGNACVAALSDGAGRLVAVTARASAKRDK